MDVSLTVSQVSRVAVIGANGAGKSTAIKASKPKVVRVYACGSKDFLELVAHFLELVPFSWELVAHFLCLFVMETGSTPVEQSPILVLRSILKGVVLLVFGAPESPSREVLVGEQLPTEGSIWKAQGLRLAYVAQHAFHHLEKHMQAEAFHHWGLSLSIWLKKRRKVPKWLALGGNMDPV